MTETDNQASNSAPAQVIQVPAPPEGTTLHMRIDREPDTASIHGAGNFDASYRESEPLVVDATPLTNAGYLSAGVGGLIGWLGSETYVGAQMFDFDGRVDNLVRNDIMNGKRGVGAAVDSAGAIDAPALGGLGPGVSSHALRQAHEYNLVQTGEFPFAKMVKKYGAWPVTLTATAAGAVLGYGVYKALIEPTITKAVGEQNPPNAPQSTSESDKQPDSWKDKVSTSPVGPDQRTL